MADIDTLIKRLASGEQEAFERLYDLLADRLYAYIATLVHRRADVDDVLQNVFVRLVRSRSKLPAVRQPTAYVFRIARNEAFRWNERAANKPPACSLEHSEMLFEPNTEEGRPRQEDVEMIGAGLAQLPDVRREIVMLKMYAGLTFIEIAETLEMPQGTVATHYRRAIGQLRKLLGDEAES